MIHWIYLIQHSKNGYVHCTFENKAAAQQFMRELESRDNYAYHIVERELFKHAAEVGHLDSMLRSTAI